MPLDGKDRLSRAGPSLPWGTLQPQRQPASPRDKYLGCGGAAPSLPLALASGLPSSTLLPSPVGGGGGLPARDQAFSLHGPGGFAPSLALDCTCPAQIAQDQRLWWSGKEGQLSPGPSPPPPLFPSPRSPPRAGWPVFCLPAWQNTPLLGAQSSAVSPVSPGDAPGLPDLQLGEGPPGWVDLHGGEWGAGHPSSSQDLNRCG